MGLLADMRARLTPDTLRARLVLTILLTNVIVLGGAVVLLRSVTYTYELQVARERAGARLSEFRSFLDLRTEGLALMGVNFSEWNEFYDYSAAGAVPDQEWLDSELAGWLPLRSEADRAVWVDADGDVLWSLGPAAEVARLTSLTAELDGEALRGPVELPDGPAVVVALPITGFPAQAPAGYFVLSESIDDALAGSFAEVSRATDVKIAPASGTGGGPGDVRTRGFSDVRTSLSGATLHLTADITGWDGAPVGSIVLEDPDPTADRPPYVGLLTLTGAGVLSLITALLLAVATTRFVRRPVDDLADYVNDVAKRALEGAPHEPIVIASSVPAELRAMLELVDDLTQRLARRQAELRDAVRQATGAEEMLRIAVNDSPEAKILLVDGVVRLANPAATAQLGETEDSILGVKVNDVLRGRTLRFPDSDDAFTLEQILERAAAKTVTVVLQSRKRGPRWLEIAAVTHPGSGELLITSRDVTEERRREELRGEILDIVSHDLKSPIAVMSGYLDLLERETSGDVAEKSVAGARAAIDSMLELLEDLQATTRAEAIFAPRTMAPVRLDLLAVEVADMTHAATMRSIDVGTCCEVSTRGEERRLRQALLNLVGNAVKYSPDDTPIRVTIDCAEGRAFVTVEDQGPGIPLEDREHVFERFTRIDRREGKEKGKPGFGLGLYIVRAIAQSHGGVVRIEDTATGKGSRFVLDLPLASG